MANLLSRAWLNITGGSTVHKYSGGGTDVDPAVPHVVVDGAIANSVIQSIVSVGITSIQVAAADDTRELLNITNCGVGVIYLQPAGEVPSSTDFTYQLGMGDCLEVPPFLVKLQWRAVRSTGTANVNVLEGFS